MSCETEAFVMISNLWLPYTSPIVLATVHTLDFILTSIPTIFLTSFPCLLWVHCTIVSSCFSLSSPCPEYPILDSSFGARTLPIGMVLVTFRPVIFGRTVVLSGISLPASISPRLIFKAHIFTFHISPNPGIHDLVSGLTSSSTVPFVWKTLRTADGAAYLTIHTEVVLCKLETNTQSSHRMPKVASYVTMLDD